MKLPSNQQTAAILTGVVIVATALMVWNWSGTDATRWGSGFSLTSPVIGQEEEAEETEGGGAAEAVPTATITYGQAVNDYGDQRFQFSSCHGTPGSLTMKQGSTVMLDNRDDKARTVQFGTLTYKLPAYGFKLATASELGDVAILCDGGGAAVLKVQP